MTDWGFVVDNSVVNRYVKSLYNVVASLKKEDGTAKELARIKEYVLQIKNHKAFLKRISLLTDEREKTIDVIILDLNLSDYMKNFLRILSQNNRLNIILEICSSYVVFLDKINNKKTFYLTFAKVASDSIIKQYAGYLEKTFGGTVNCVVKHDSSLIDGVNIQYHSKILDYSLKSRLKRLDNVIRSENYEN